jgi:hypothetical protein
MAAPAMTQNARGNVQSAGTLAASGTATLAVDATAKFEVQIQIEVVFGTVAATAGLQIDVFRRFGLGPTDDTIAVLTFVIPATASTTKIQSFALPTGKYDVKETNLDATNGLTGLNLTTSTIDSIA